MTPDRPAVSTVVLCYRAGAPITAFLDRIREEGLRRGIPSELVLVANHWAGDDDPTPEIVREYARDRPGCRVVALPKEGHMGWDMRSGLAAARGETVVVIDGDGQFAPELVYEVHERLQAESLDLCMTHRVVREDGLYRRLTSLVFNALFRLLFPGPRYRDVNSKPKAIRAPRLERMDLRASDWFIDAEIMIHARRLKLRVGSFPIRFAGSARASFVRVGAVFEFLRNLIAYRIRERGRS